MINKTKNKVPPEGGWGYMICVGLTLIYVGCMAPANSQGMIFSDLVGESKNGGKFFTTVNGVSGILISLSGVFVNVGLRWFTLRQMALLGAFSYTLCWLLDVFVTRVQQLVFTNGVLSGFGYGLLNMISYVVFNSYFVEKRVMMMSACMAVVGLCSIAAPFIVEVCLERYGYRGTVALVAAFSANTFVGAALYQPVEWHLKTVHDGSLIRNNADGEGESIAATEADVKACERADGEQRLTLWEKIEQKFNLKILKNITFWNICIGLHAGMVGDIQFCLVLPLLLLEYGFSASEIATCVSIISIADLTSRIFLIVIGKLINIKSYNWYFVGLFLTMIGRIFLLQVSNFVLVAVTLSFLGFLRAWIYIMLPLLIAEELPEEDYTQTIGLALFLNGFINIIYAPSIGFAKDLSDSFKVTIYILALTILIPTCTYLYELYFVRPRKRKSVVRDIC